MVWKANEMEVKRGKLEVKNTFKLWYNKEQAFLNQEKKKLNTEREKESSGWDKGEWAAESYKSPIKLSGLIALQLNVHFLCLYWQGCQLHSSSLFTLYVGGCMAGCKSQPLFGVWVVLRVKHLLVRMPSSRSQPNWFQVKIS